jgi:hypothetical protein
MAENKSGHDYFTINARGTMIDAPIELRDYSIFIAEWLKNRKDENQICYIDAKADDIHKMLDEMRGNLCRYIRADKFNLTQERSFADKFKLYASGRSEGFHSDIIIYGGDEFGAIERSPEIWPELTFNDHKDKLFVRVDNFENEKSIKTCSLLFHESYFFLSLITTKCDEKGRKYEGYFYNDERSLEEYKKSGNFERYHFNFIPDEISEEENYYIVTLYNLKAEITKLLLKNSSLLSHVYGV